VLQYPAAFFLSILLAFLTEYAMIKIVQGGKDDCG